MKSLGIYKLEGNLLTWCWSELGSSDRPRTFVADESHPGQNLLTFKREKPKSVSWRPAVFARKSVRR
jgi:hypothetical protein